MQKNSNSTKGLCFLKSRGLGKVEGDANGAEKHLLRAELSATERKWYLTVSGIEAGPWEGTPV